MHFHRAQISRSRTAKSFWFHFLPFCRIRVLTGTSLQWYCAYAANEFSMTFIHQNVMPLTRAALPWKRCRLVNSKCVKTMCSFWIQSKQKQCLFIHHIAVQLELNEIVWSGIETPRENVKLKLRWQCQCWRENLGSFEYV